ncbi:MAG: hypothetical protein ACK5CQ_08985, partial [Cyanobacteriota bacterium]
GAADAVRASIEYMGVEVVAEERRRQWEEAALLTPAACTAPGFPAPSVGSGLEQPASASPLHWL